MPKLIAVKTNGTGHVLFAPRPFRFRNAFGSVGIETAAMNLDDVFKTVAALADSFDRATAGRRWKGATMELGLSFTQEAKAYIVSASATESITVTFTF
ncbi:MAG TPA: CU044_2847 family protein [Gemmatimonadaceae bacterium]|nr:CU044_2847 family protein [Gemmatimonadaceae bacterium]